MRAMVHRAENGPRPDSADSTPNVGKKKALTGGARVAEKEGGGEWGASWAGEGELGRRWDFWAAGKEEKGRGRKERWAGPKQERGEERKGFPFLKRFQHIHLNLNLENLNSTKPNQLNKCNSA